MRQIVVGMATCGVAAGADKVYEKLKEEIQARGAEDKVKLKITGCIGMCYREPLVEVREEDGRSVIYGDVDPKRAVEILEKHAIGGEPIPEWVVLSNGFEGISGEGNQLLAGQVRIVLRNCGIIDPENIDDYLARDGYKALEKVLKTMTPEEVIDEIYKSGLRGRGGAGFPTGLKWKFTRAAKGDKKYVVCNADEGDPGAFMDRSTL
ncbi:MAG: NADH-quinone oxidoreductase subunit F, partial [Thermoplasmata archaeon]